MQLAGKKVAFLGDSITEGHGVADKSCRFDNRLAAQYGLEAVNFGIGGTRLAHQRKASDKPRHDLCFCGRAYDLPKDTDVIVVYGGTNDYGHGDAPFGTNEDRTPETFCGAVHFLMQFLRTEYPAAKLVFMTPARRRGDERALPIPGRCEDKHPLIAYVDEILTVAREYGIATVDLYRELGIDPNREEDVQRYAPDGLHFNEEGHGVIAKLLGPTLEAL